MGKLRGHVVTDMPVTNGDFIKWLQDLDTGAMVNQELQDKPLKGDELLKFVIKRSIEINKLKAGKTK